MKNAPINYKYMEIGLILQSFTGFFYREEGAGWWEVPCRAKTLARIAPQSHCAFNIFLVSERVPRLESRACQTLSRCAAAAAASNRGSSNRRAVS